MQIIELFRVEDTAAVALRFASDPLVNQLNVIEGKAAPLVSGHESLKLVEKIKAMVGFA